MSNMFYHLQGLQLLFRRKREIALAGLVAQNKLVRSVDTGDDEIRECLATDVQWTEALLQLRICETNERLGGPEKYLGGLRRTGAEQQERHASQQDQQLTVPHLFPLG